MIASVTAGWLSAENHVLVFEMHDIGDANRLTERDVGEEVVCNMIMSHL